MPNKNRSVLNPSLPSPYIQGPPLVKHKPCAKQSIAQQLLAKFENKYSSANTSKSAKATESEISDSEPNVETEGDDAKVEFKKIEDGEEIYESDFETSGSETSVVSKTHHREENPFLPLDLESEINSSEESIHENILSLEELLEKDGNLPGSPANHSINNECDKASEVLETEMIETNDKTADHSNKYLIEKSLPQSRNQANKSSIIEKVASHENILTFKELLLSKKANKSTAAGNYFTADFKESIDCKLYPAEIIEEVETESISQIVNDHLGLLQSTIEVNPGNKINPDIGELLLLTDKTSSPTKLKSNSPPENSAAENQPRTKPKRRRKSREQSLDERRHLERMFFLVENQSLAGVSQQPRFSPLAMSWERQANSEDVFDSVLSTHEDAFAEMLRLRLRLTRDKMAAEYAAYRANCEAARLLAATHRPVTLAVTRQIIAQMKPSQPPVSPT